MDDGIFKELENEIKNYKDRKEYAACIQRMKEREKEATNPEVRAVVLLAKATCALQIGNLALAEEAASAIDMQPLSPEMRNYVSLVRADISSSTGQSERAESLYSAIIASKEARTEQQPDALYEAFARLGFLYAHKNRFAAALDLLQKASILMPNGDLRDDIGIWLGYCLQALNRLDKAKECLRDVLDHGSGEMIVDAYYRLGAVQLQTGDYDDAIDSFQRALSSLPHGRTKQADILAALSEAEEEQADTGTNHKQITRSRFKPPVQ
jgi:tetratricopeptide (TPR) repeat protein